MATINTYVCDICSAQRKETNHWFHAHKVGEGGILLFPWKETLFDGERTFSSGTAVAHLCGESCVTRWVQSKLPTRTAGEEPKTGK